MADPTYGPLSSDDHESHIRIALCAQFTEYDRAIIREAQRVIRRSRDLLEETNHRVRAPAEARSAPPLDENARLTCSGGNGSSQERSRGAHTTRPRSL